MSEALLAPVTDQYVAPPAAHAEVSQSFVQRLGGRLPGPDEALEAIGLSEEDIRAGRVMSGAESVKRLRRIVAQKT